MYGTGIITFLIYKQIKDENIHIQIRVNTEESTLLMPCIISRDENSLQELQASHDGTQNYVHLGIAVGLLCVGLAVGAITTCLLCTCVPKLHRKVTIIMMRNGASRRDGKKQETTGLYPQERRTSLARVNSSSDSHIYNIIQHDIRLASHGPIEMGLTNSKNPAKSFEALQAISPPDYTIAADTTIESSSPSTEPMYQSLTRTLVRPACSYGPLEPFGNTSNTPNQSRADINMHGNTATTVDHNYFVLKPGSSIASDLMSGEQEVANNSAHAYFVLEKKKWRICCFK
ncbi:hypothetical protein DPMN_117990 [Dreissena polymorpha]|uniref:Uncharacterized protein n=1 Tax=Dreissena polymorpha TaxID=45954 RepID=A0A9D4GFX6_DREPO|nr:hypothetical protein DPMN_117990 [Dreissena polymorpha]